MKALPLRKVRRLAEDPRGQMRREDGIPSARGSELRPLATCCTPAPRPGTVLLEEGARRRKPQAGVGRLISSVRIRETRYHLKEANRFGGETK